MKQANLPMKNNNTSTTFTTTPSLCLHPLCVVFFPGNFPGDVFPQPSDGRNLERPYNWALLEPEKLELHNAGYGGLVELGSPRFAVDCRRFVCFGKWVGFGGRWGGSGGTKFLGGPVRLGQGLNLGVRFFWWPEVYGQMRIVVERVNFEQWEECWCRDGCFLWSYFECKNGVYFFCIRNKICLTW